MRLSALFRPPRRFLVSNMDTLAPLIVRLRLQSLPGYGACTFPYRAGQFAFVRVGAPGLSRRYRSLTMVSSPESGDAVSFMVGASDDWSLGLVDAAEIFPGSDARNPWAADIIGPCGRFTLEDRMPAGCESGPLVFLAEGLGVAPFLSMALTLAARGEHRRVLILWAARTRQELACLDDLIALTQANPSISTIPILSHDPLWNGRRGTLDRATLTELVGPELADSRSTFWIGAAGALTASVRRALGELGIPRRRIRYQPSFLQEEDVV
ncbi:MAG: hypothetical protein E4H20_01255 [Spirochaetales bacterium]|nr:MAG: hypothetical protein E4H20_01255 [Spirochaetales bacterium]